MSIEVPLLSCLQVGRVSVTSLFSLPRSSVALNDDDRLVRSGLVSNLLTSSGVRIRETISSLRDWYPGRQGLGTSVHNVTFKSPKSLPEMSYPGSLGVKVVTGAGTGTKGYNWYHG